MEARSQSNISLLQIPEDEDGIEAGPIAIQEKDDYSKGYFGNWKWWVPVCVYIILIVAGQASGTILGKLYYLQGGSSTWLVTLAQTAGFPILIPFLFMFSFTKHNRKLEHDGINVVTRQQKRQPASVLVRGCVYLVFGALSSTCSFLYSGGMERLPASTFSLIISSQLGFNTVFSFLLNGQKFTPYVTNSVVILTFSCVLIVFDPDTNGTIDTYGAFDRSFVLGFVLTVSSSALTAFVFSLMEFYFERIIRSRTLEETVKLLFWDTFFATVFTLIGMFLARDYSDLFGENNYAFMIVMMAVSWQSYNVGVIGLTSKVSALFSNSVIIVSSVFVPFWCMMFLHEEFGGLKVVSLLMALWGFSSYIYQQYLDDLNGS